MDFGLWASFGVDSQNDALTSEPLRGLSDETRVLDRRGVERDLICPSEEEGPDILKIPNAAPHGEGGKGPFGRLFDDADQNLPAFGRRGDVEEDQFIGPLSIVSFGNLCWISRVPEVHEPGPLDHPAILDIQAGDDASC